MPASDLKIAVTALFASLVALAAVPARAGQSTITEAEGRACMGEDHSRKETQDQALADAKRMAAESALTHIRSETTVKNLALEKDLVEAYTRADVRMLGVLESAWYKDEHIGDCHRVRIRAEVVPDEQGMRRLAEDEAGAASDPTAPLGIKVWTSQAAYRSGEKMRIFLRANKPFFGRVLYEQANGAAVQLLPNPFRSADDFLGGAVYEIPSGKDGFELEIGGPFGAERVVVYGSTTPLGPIETAPAGGLYEVRTRDAEVGVRLRGVTLKAKQSGGVARVVPAEFVEAEARVQTAP